MEQTCYEMAQTCYEAAKICAMRNPLTWLFPDRGGKSTSGSPNRSRPEVAASGISNICVRMANSYSVVAGGKFEPRDTLGLHPLHADDVSVHPFDPLNP